VAFLVELIEDAEHARGFLFRLVARQMIEHGIAERIVDLVGGLLGGETGGEVGTESFMLGNADAAALWGAMALIVADQPFDFEGFALHRAALPAAASVDEKMRSISDAGIMAAP
jgi:hypothetical protein